MKTTLSRADTGRLALTYLGRDCEFVTNIAPLKEFVAAVFSNFINPAPSPGATNRFSVIGKNEGVIDLNVDGRRFALDDICPVEAVVYQQMADWLLAGRDGFVPLHAAALSAPGVGLVLAGGRGSGKSTLTAALMSFGFKLLSDDAAVVQMRGRWLHPFPRAIGLMQEDDGFKMTRGHAVASLKMIPGGEEKTFFTPDAAAAETSATEVTHLLFLGDARPPGESAIILANKLNPERIDPAEEPVVESTEDGLAYVRLTSDGALAEQLGACRRRGLLPLGIEPMSRERPYFRTDPKAVRLAADEALIRLWQALKPAALTGENPGKLFYALGHFLRGLPAWAISPGTPEATARLITEITEGAR